MKKDVLIFNPYSSDEKILECSISSNVYFPRERSRLKNTFLTESDSFNFPAKGGFLNFSFLVHDEILDGFYASGSGGYVQQNKNKI